MRPVLSALLAFLIAACGGAPSGARHSSGAGGASDPSERAARAAHLFGLTVEALPELASVWDALAANAATEIGETVQRDTDGLIHCLSVVVAGDLARQAREAWEAGAAQAGLACERDEDDLRCRDQTITLHLLAGDRSDPLDALAAEMGVDIEAASTALACARGLPPARLASIDERLHRAGLLEPWLELHERLGERRLRELRWTRSPEQGDMVAVHYEADDEAFELATEWARAAGLAGGDPVWQRIGAPSSIGVEILRGADPEIQLTLTRDP